MEPVSFLHGIIGDSHLCVRQKLQKTEDSESDAKFPRQLHHPISSASFDLTKAEMWCVAPRGQTLHSHKISVEYDQ